MINKASNTLILLLLIGSLLIGGMLSGCAEEDGRQPVGQTLAPTFPASGGLAQAAAEWETVLSDNPSDPQANYQLGLILAINSPEKALKYLNAAKASKPELSQKINRVTGALRIGELSENPAYRLTLLGQALGALGEWQLASSALLIATEQDPDYAEAWAYLGEAQQQNGEDGFDALSTALNLDPQSYSANLLMALYWRRNNAPGEALPLLLTAANQDPNNLTLKEDIANSYAEMGEVETSLNFLQQIVDQFPEDSQSWQMLVRLCLTYDLKIEELALPAARQAVLLAEDDPNALILLGRTYFQIGNLAIAIRFLNAASLLAPDSPEPHYYLGLVYLNQGDIEAAQTELSLAYQLAPAETIGLQALRTLEQYFSYSD